MIAARLLSECSFHHVFVIVVFVLNDIGHRGPSQNGLDYKIITFNFGRLHLRVQLYKLVLLLLLNTLYFLARSYLRSFQNLGLVLGRDKLELADHARRNQLHFILKVVHHHLVIHLIFIFNLNFRQTRCHKSFFVFLVFAPLL